MQSIARVESKLKPLVIGLKGKSIFAKDLIEAEYKVMQLVKNGELNIDIGVMQLNYRWHNHNFANLKEMLKPANNIEYAAKYLCNLRNQHKSWHKAVRYYHSSNAFYYKKYSRKVILTWLSSTTTFNNLGSAYGFYLSHNKAPTKCRKDKKIEDDLSNLEKTLL